MKNAYLPLTAWPFGDRSVSIDGQIESVLAVSGRLTYACNLLGLPAISLPYGMDERGLPIGLQIAGPAFGEGTVLRCATFAERSAGGPMARQDPALLTIHDNLFPLAVIHTGQGQRSFYR